MTDKLAIALISPLGTAIALMVLALVALVLRRRRSGIALFGFALLWLWTWSLPGAANLLLYGLESQHPPQPVHSLPEAQAIVVLGGAVRGTAFDGAVAQPINLGAGADRVWYGARLYHRGKAPAVLLTGGPYVPAPYLTEAGAMAVLLEDLGVPSSAILLENRSRNTRENAVYSAQLLRGLAINRILLVTSALHMERARRHFAAEGLEVIPAPTDFESFAGGYGYSLVPDVRALDASGRAMKEWVGQFIWR